MIKILNRSIWYYIDRPAFAISLAYATPSKRIYSLFVMDLIEQDLIEYRRVPPYYSDTGWYIKNTNEKIDENFTVIFIDELLREKKDIMRAIDDVDRVKEKIEMQLTALKGKNEEKS